MIIIWDIEIKAEYPRRRQDFCIVNKKRTCQLMNFAFQVDYKEKLKESKN